MRESVAEDCMYDTPWAVGERIESLLDHLLVTLKPTLGSERINVVAPYFLIPMDSVGRHAQHGAFREELPADG